MSLSLYGVPDGQQKGQSTWPCPSVYSPATALGSLSSVALSSAPAPLTLAQRKKRDANYHHFFTRIWSGFLVEATNPISSGFLMSQFDSLPQLKTHSKFERKNGGSLRRVCGSVLESLAPARRIGQRWRATRAPWSVSIRMGRAKCSALSAAHPVLRKAINS